MASERTYRIGEWLFAPADNELRRNGERRRLEHRAARALELLCENAGRTVPREEIVRQVWNGRSQSPNSLPVVIGDLRRALDDDARNPRFIETVAKSGYRLIADPPAEAAPARPARKLVLVLLMALLLLPAIAGGLALWELRSGEDVVAFREVVNASGSPAYDPLARATSELIVADLSRRGRLIRRSGNHGKVLLSARLIDWNGEPTVALSATDPATGAVWWSRMARGPADAIPDNVSQALAEFDAELAKRD